jgi:hypothetical protein
MSKLNRLQLRSSKQMDFYFNYIILKLVSAPYCVTVNKLIKKSHSNKELFGLQVPLSVIVSLNACISLLLCQWSQASLKFWYFSCPSCQNNIFVFYGVCETWNSLWYSMSELALNPLHLRTLELKYGQICSQTHIQVFFIEHNAHNNKNFLFLFSRLEPMEPIPRFGRQWELNIYHGIIIRWE